MPTPDPRPAGETALTDQQVARIIGEVEARVGMGHGAWDMVKPDELVEGFRAALLTGVVVWVARDTTGFKDTLVCRLEPGRTGKGDRVWFEPKDADWTIADKPFISDALGLAPGECARVRLVREG